MNHIPRTTLEVVRKRLTTQNPVKGRIFGMVTTNTSLLQPDNPRNRFSGTIRWPIEGDPYSTCDYRVNFPGERLRNGQGYVGTKFRYEELVDERTYKETGLLIVHGIGEVGLVEPLSAIMTETLTNGVDPNADSSRTSYGYTEAAGLVLAKFGIVE